MVVKCTAAQMGNSSSWCYSGFQTMLPSAADCEWRCWLRC
jgi:hypothetical protein